MTDRICSFSSCERPAKAKGLCAAHWQQQYDGKPLTPIKIWRNDWSNLRRKIEDRLDKPDGESGCWVWSGGVNRDGYGQIKVGGSRVVVHRAYLLVLGVSIPDGLTLDHLCRNRACVNPDHLEPVTCKENVLRGFGITALNARKTHCKRGHPFDEANTYIAPDGSRQCRKCRNRRSSEWSATT